MRQANGETYVTIGEAAKRIGRGIQTIKNWYEWFNDQPHTTQAARLLPPCHTWLDTKGTRYFREADLPVLEKFRDSIRYGQLASVSRRKWGNRGREKEEQ